MCTEFRSSCNPYSESTHQSYRGIGRLADPVPSPYTMPSTGGTHTTQNLPNLSKAWSLGSHLLTSNLWYQSRLQQQLILPESHPANTNMESFITFWQSFFAIYFTYWFYNSAPPQMSSTQLRHNPTLFPLLRTTSPPSACSGGAGGHKAADWGSTHL